MKINPLLTHLLCLKKYQKAFRIMKLSFFIMFFCVFQLFAINTEAQNAVVELKSNKMSIEELFKEIENQTDYLVVYSTSGVRSNFDLFLTKKKAQVAELLNEALKGRGLKYEFVNNYIILSNAESNAVAQQGQKMVTGVVLDQNEEPVIGANVVEKGTTNGTVTDVEGRFSLNVASDATLVISYIGYVSSEISVKGQNAVKVTLKEDTETLDEVVVVGYGTQKKLNLTGAVTAVSGDELSKRPVTNTATMLQGQVPGLRVVQGTGQPGAESVSFRVRGVGTFSGAGANPLVLINGVTGDMSALDPSMIESVSVLKDAASCAIYGSRAANGVILITTKQGADENDKVKISYHGNFAFHTPTKMYDLITDSPEYMTLFNQAKINSGEGGLYPEEEIEKYRNSNGSVQYPSFDWLDYMFNPAFVHQHNLSLAGSVKKTTYNVALNYVDQDGTMRASNYKKYNVTADLTTYATDWMKVGFYTSLMKGDRNYYSAGGQDDVILSAMSNAPTYMPWLPDDGSGVKRYTQKAYSYELMNKNMAMICEEGVFRRTNISTDVNAQLWLDIQLAKGLTWYTKGAVRQINTRNEYWIGNPRPLYNYHTGEEAGTYGGYGYTVEEYRTFYTNLYSYLKYEFTTPNKMHNLSIMAGYSQETNKYETLSAYRRDYPFELETIDAGIGAPNWSNGGGLEEWALMSGFFRLNYNFNDRYLFEANARYDGSSRLSPEGRWDLFPSFSAAWRLTEEEFMKNLNWSWLNNTKVRASWGKLGNQEIGIYPYQALISAVSSYPYDKSTPSSAYTQTAYVNRDLKWETTTVFDIGADLQLFDRLNVTFDWYKKETDDILRSSQISGLLGMSAPIVNDGTLQDKGIELAFAWNDNVNKGVLNGLNYNLGFYVDRTRNTLVKFGPTEKSSVIRQEGLPYNSYYMLDCIGIFATQEEIDNAPKQYGDNTMPGDLRYRDANNDGVINDDDRVVIDGMYPSFEYGFNLGATWKGFDLSLLTQGVAGKKCYISPEWGEAPFFQGSAPTKDYVKGMWTEENPYNAEYPKLYFGNMGGQKNTRANSYFLKDVSYFRLKNLTFGYTLPRELTRKFAVQRLRLYFSGDNLLTCTKYKGLDPERAGDGRSTQYPQNRICSIGINIDF